MLILLANLAMVLLNLRLAEDFGWTCGRGVLLFLGTFLFVAKFLLMWGKSE